MSVKVLATSLLLIICPAVMSAPIKRVEPPFWWAGFVHTELQLMVQGENVSAYKPSIDADGVSIARVERGNSPNYLFVYLDLSSASPGSFDIVFVRGDEQFSHTYELRRRTPGQVGTYDSSDVVYLVTPDRFVNGNPSNDSVEGYADELDRDDDYGRHGGDLEGLRRHLDYIADITTAIRQPTTTRWTLASAVTSSIGKWSPPRANAGSASSWT